MLYFEIMKDIMSNNVLFYILEFLKKEVYLIHKNLRKEKCPYFASCYLSKKTHLIALAHSF